MTHFSLTCTLKFEIQMLHTLTGYNTPIKKNKQEFHAWALSHAQDFESIIWNFWLLLSFFMAYYKLLLTFPNFMFSMWLEAGRAPVWENQTQNSFWHTTYCHSYGSRPMKIFCQVFQEWEICAADYRETEIDILGPSHSLLNTDQH